MATLLAVLSLAVAPQAAERPVPATQGQDAVCLAAFAMLAANPAAKEAGTMGSIYFMGKPLGRDPAVDLKAVMTRTAPTLEAKGRLETELKRCAAELKATGSYMQAVGGALKAPAP
ncbi:hypothetical protein [Sphingomonas aracearum]|uniref:Uncharacterized protein n=1 Tax=Sphingomonas aracearum TaxID=2283317 RepID=A0A369VYN4_9SPHN|nr:hypothetical protein [Sphingomonas aracearum]RDE07253.1 hypothetical protein DVW87_06390 [Sphingomonas aracearum]